MPNRPPKDIHLWKWVKLTKGLPCISSKLSGSQPLLKTPLIFRPAWILRTPLQCRHLQTRGCPPLATKRPSSLIMSTRRSSRRWFWPIDVEMMLKPTLLQVRQMMYSSHYSSHAQHTHNLFSPTASSYSPHSPYITPHHPHPAPSPSPGSPPPYLTFSPKSGCLRPY